MFDQNAWAIRLTELQKQREEAHASFMRACDAVTLHIANGTMQTGSAADVLAQPMPELGGEDFEWRNVTEAYGLGALLVPLKLEIVRFKERVDGGANNGPVTSVTFADVSSELVSAIGAELARIEGRVMARIHVRFKGGGYYRYWPFELSVWNGLVYVAHKVEEGNAGYSVGSYVHTHIKLMHEGGGAQCEKWDTERSVWVNVLTKSEKKALVKNIKSEVHTPEAAITALRETPAPEEVTLDPTEPPDPDGEGAQHWGTDGLGSAGAEEAHLQPDAQAADDRALEGIGPGQETPLAQQGDEFDESF
jgi:hypothetical protein